MGIPGLTTYIEDHSDIYYRPHNLRNCRLVIDGNSLIYQLCNANGTNFAFGGDYDSMARSIDHFFDKLAKCNVDPLVIFDGGMENKKFKTALKRLEMKIANGANYSPATGCSASFLPINLKEVTTSVMSKRNVFFASAMLEADSEIAAVAKSLDCPVLSLDSDFYIYDVAYIPWNTLKDCCHVKTKSTSKNSSGGKKKGSFAMKCKIYRLERLLGNFEGMDKSVVPMIAVLLGNDYVSKSQIPSYSRKFAFSRSKVKPRRNQPRRIEKTLRWLCDRTLERAIAKILGRVPEGDKEKSISIIEMVVNGYVDLCPRILRDLRFSQEYIGSEDLPQPEVFRYCKNTEDLESDSEESWSESEKEEEEEDGDDENDDQDDSEEEEEEKIGEAQINMEDSIYRVLPEWFIRQFQMSRFPTSFMDMLTKRLYIGLPQIEDYFYPAAAGAGLNLVKIIYAILYSGILKRQPPPSLRYYHRHENGFVTRSYLDAAQVETQLPTLHQLQDLSFDQRKKILDQALGVSSPSELEHFPPKWRLYIGTLVFWLRQSTEPRKTNCHVYAFLFGMLFGLMDEKIGYQRKALYFQKKCDSSSTTVENVSADTILEAVAQITERDCYFLGKFLIPNFSIADEVLRKRNTFNVTIVHCFNQFQDCLKYAVALNALFGFPYERPEIETLYNGTLLYNLCRNFQRRGDVGSYTELVLRDAPSFSRLFKMTIEKMENICEQNDVGVFGNVGNKSKRRKKNRSKKIVERKVDSEESQDEFVDCDEETFTDTNNPFYLLQS